MNKYSHLARKQYAPDFWKYWACERKRRYPTRYDAIAMIQLRNMLLTTYLCSYCKGYHLTSNENVLNRERGITPQPGTGDEGKTKQRGNKHGERNTE